MWDSITDEESVRTDVRRKAMHTQGSYRVGGRDLELKPGDTDWDLVGRWMSRVTD